MSAHYSSPNATPRCQHCGAVLTLNEPRCINCGYYNGALPAHKSQQQHTLPPTSPVWNAPDARGQQPQTGGLLKNYAVSPEQRNTTQPASRPRANVDPVTPPPIPFGATSQSWSNPNPAQLPARQIQGGVDANTYARSRQSGNLSPSYAQAQPSFYNEAKLQRRSQVGRIVGISAVIVAVIGASFLGYILLFAQKSTSTGSTSLQAAPTNPVPKGNPLFQDDFTSNTHGWNVQSYPGEFAVSLGNGSLKLENDSNKLLWELLPGGKTYGDFQLSVDAALSKGSQDNGYGVYVHGTLSQNMTIASFYRFELYGDGSFAIFKGTTDANGNTTTPRLVDYTNNSAILKQGGVNHIAINAVGSTMQFTVNNQTLSTVTDATYTSGAIALFVSNLQNARTGAEATFSHLALYPAQK